MSGRAVLIALAVAAIATAAQAGQYESTRAAGTSQQQQVSAEASLCGQAQPTVARILEAANARLELARQNNSPAAMRAAVDDLQGALRDLRAQLAPCAAIPAQDPHAGHSMSTAPAAPATSSGTPPASDPSTAPAPAGATPGAKPQAGADPHAGHTAAPPAAPPARATAARPRAAAPAEKPTAASTDAHAGHVTGSPSAQPPTAGTAASRTSQTPSSAVDPVCGLKVDPNSAPQASYRGQTYYFCSEQHRQLFMKDSAKYAPKERR